MPNTPEVRFRVEDGTQVVTSALAGLNCMLVQTNRGPYGTISPIITSWSDFTRTYGGLDPALVDTTLVKRALDGGSNLRIVKVGPGDEVIATADDTIEDSLANELFSFTPKYKGAAWNALVLAITAASNGDTDAFDLQIQLVGDSTATPEVYKNLKIVGTPTVAESDYLLSVAQESSLVDVVYNDLSGLTSPIVPVAVVVGYENGTDGSAVDAADYTAAIPATDEVDDITLVCAPSISDNAFNVALGAKADSRKDIIAALWLGDSSDENTLITARATTNIDSEFVAFYGGALRITNTDPNDPNVEMEISPLGDVLAASGLTDAELGPWISYAGPDRGKIFALGVVNNFGTKGKFEALNKLANRQINMVINRNNTNMIWHGFTAQQVESQKSFISIVKLTQYIAKSLTPTYESFIEQPLDLRLVRQMHDIVKPFMDELTTPSKRALFDYKYDGDQNIFKVENLVVNDPAQFGLGKYKVNIFLKAIAPLQDIEVTLILSPAGVTFS